MDEGTAREKHWAAVSLLNEVIDAGASDKAETMRELENDLNG